MTDRQNAPEDRRAPQPVSDVIARILLTANDLPANALSDYSDHDVIRAAAIHGIGPLLGLRLEQGELGPSAAAAAWMAEQVTLCRQRHALLRHDLAAVLDAFQEATIDIVPLKGAALLLCEVADVGWRPMADLDLLVTVPHQRAVDLAFAHAGYCLPATLNTGLSGLTWKHLEYELCDHEWPKLQDFGEHPDHPRKIDAHFRVRELYRGIGWDITPYIMDELVELNGRLVPGDTALALHFVVHATFAIFERKARISQLIDLQQRLSPSAVQGIANILRRAGARQHARFLYPALALLVRFAPSELHSRFTAALAPYTPKTLREWLAQKSLAELSYEARHDVPDLLGDRLLATSARERLRLAANRLLPLPRDLSGAGYTGSSRRAILSWYGAYYRRELHDLADKLPGP